MSKNPNPDKRELRAVIAFHFRLGHTVQKTYDLMLPAYGVHTPVQHTIANRFRKLEAGNFSLEDEARSGRPPNHDHIEAVRSAVEESKISSVRQVSEVTGVPFTTAYSILKERLGLRKFMGRWVPHHLNPTQKQARVNIAREMLETLRGPRRNLLNILTSDESWFRLTQPDAGQWAASRDDIEPRIRDDFSAKKAHVTVIWGLRGPLLVDYALRGESLNTNRFKTLVFPKLKQAALGWRQKTGLTEFVLHWDNAPFHRSKDTLELLDQENLATLPHPPYSPDLAPCDFYLFGYLKHCLKGLSFDTENELISAIWVIMTKIPKTTLHSVYEQWIHRLESVIEHGGEYYKE